jgi:hypothetical protein
MYDVISNFIIRDIYLGGNNMANAALGQKPREKSGLQIKKEHNIAVKEVGDEALSQIEKILNRKVEEVISVSKNGDYWHVRLEVLERKAVPDTQDILGIYELKVDSKLDVIDYKRIGMRHRGDMIELEED